MTSRRVRSLGQDACQGGLGHSWDPIPNPTPGYRPSYGRALHFRCDRCLTIKRVIILRDYRYRTQYIYPHDWVKHRGSRRYDGLMEIFKYFDDYVDEAVDD